MNEEWEDKESAKDSDACVEREEPLRTDELATLGENVATIAHIEKTDLSDRADEETSKARLEAARALKASAETMLAEKKAEEERRRVEELVLETEKKRRERKSNIIFYSVLGVLLIAILLFRGYWTKNFGGVIVDGHSMDKTLYDGEQLLMQYATEKKQVQRGDVIVVYVGGYPECQSVKSEYLIKRLIAIEGDKVKCEDGQVYICYAGTTEYVALEEDYAYFKTEQDRMEYDFGEYTVDEGEIFFLGDNRGNSCDSRYNEPGGSHLNDLYKREDVYGVVPEWAIEHQEILESIFFRTQCNG